MSTSRVRAGVPTGGQFAEQSKSEADVSLDGHPTPKPSPSELAQRPGALGVDELDTLDYAISVLEDKIDEGENYPGTYEPDELNELREKRDRLVNRVSYLDALQSRASAEQRLAALGAQHREIEKQVQLAAVEALRDIARDAHPDAAYFTMVDSDQGHYMTGGAVYDKDGNELDVGEWGFDDEGRGSWLLDGADQADYWTAETVDSAAMIADGVPESVADSIAHQPGYGVRVLKAKEKGQ